MTEFTLFIQNKTLITLQFVEGENDFIGGLMFKVSKFTLEGQIGAWIWQLYSQINFLSDDFISSFYCIILFHYTTGCFRVRGHFDTPLSS